MTRRWTSVVPFRFSTLRFGLEVSFYLYQNKEGFDSRKSKGRVGSLLLILTKLGTMNDRVVPCSFTTLSTLTVRPHPLVRPIVCRVHSRRSSGGGLRDDGPSHVVWSRSRVGTSASVFCAVQIYVATYTPVRTIGWLGNPSTSGYVYQLSHWGH